MTDPERPPRPRRIKPSDTIPVARADLDSLKQNAVASLQRCRMNDPRSAEDLLEKMIAVLERVGRGA